MHAYLLEWLSLLGRWVHVVTVIAWIGASFYFVWLDNHLLPPRSADLMAKGVGGELWAVHGGGFYNAQKYRVAPTAIPESLHWFYWEAYSTWLSGFFLICLLYYRDPTQFLVDPRLLALSPTAAVGIGLGTLAGGWLVYDALCRSPLGRSDRALGVVLAVLLCAAAWGLCRIFNGRGAFLQFGAMLGTIMVANVFFVIIPGQRAMVAAARAGRPVDPAPGIRAKQRSVHNTYFTLPVLFAMISHHYPLGWAAPHNWAVLIGMSAGGAAIRGWFVARHKAQLQGRRASPVPAVAGVLAIALVAWALRPAAPATPPAGDAAAVSFVRAQSIVLQRCAGCHAEHPTQPGYAIAPKGQRFDTSERIRAQADAIGQQVASRAMPLGNITQMTDEERAALLSWIEQGAAGP
jgi:uncharacterized membrane protein